MSKLLPIGQKPFRASNNQSEIKLLESNINLDKLRLSMDELSRQGLYVGSNNPNLMLTKDQRREVEVSLTQNERKLVKKRLPKL